MPPTVESEHGQYVFARVRSERRERLVQIAALAGALVCVALAAALHAPINQQRTQLQLITHSNVYKDLPPVYVLVGAAGGPLRAITSICLWIRDEKLKEEGKYFQSDTIARWICTLQPRFPTVWVNRAWNLSYNISVGCYTRSERWGWVYNGIRLLRDEGIPNNDRTVALYQQLAWIWFHKVGDRLDDFHRYYKRQWAANMETLLGTPPAGASDEVTIDWFRPVAEAPRRLDEVIAAHPGVVGLVARLAQRGVDVNAETDNNRIFHPLEKSFFRPYTAWATAQSLRVLRSSPEQTTQDEAGLAPVFDQAPQADLDALLAYLRAKVLREQYKMDPAYMLELTGLLGTEKPIPIDWRTPYSQAIYWAMYGVKKGKELKTVREFDIIATDRVLLFSLSTLRESGRYTFRLNLDDPMDSYLVMGPDFRYLEALHNTYIRVGPEHAEEGEDTKGKTAEILKTGHINFLRDSTVDLYLAGHEAQARKWFDYLRTTYKDDFTKQTQRDYTRGLEAFVQNELKDRVDTYNGCLTTTISLLQGAYESLAAGYPDEFSAKIRWAGWAYNRYQVDKKDDPEGRRTLPPFIQMRATALREYIAPVSGQFSHPVIYSVWVWQREQDEVKQQCYDDLAPTFAALCQAEGLDVQKAFPPPPGMDAWRKAHPAPINPEDVAKEEQERKRAERIK